MIFTEHSELATDDHSPETQTRTASSNGQHGVTTFDVFIKELGGGMSFIHEFHPERDVVDLSAYNLSYRELQGAIHDVGWATEIKLADFSGEDGDRLFLKSIDADDLDSENFTL